jgi:Hypothetical glycosyl hydrolase family 15
MLRIGRKAIALALLWMTLPSCVGSPSGDTPSPIPTSNPALLWAPPYPPGDHTTTARAVAEARRFQVIGAHPWTYRGEVGAMRGAVPGLTLLAYLNGTLAQRDQGHAYPSSWYLRDADGEKVRSRQFGNFLMDPRNPGWVADRTARCRRLLRESGFDGCLLDMLGTAPTQVGYVTGAPIDPETGLPWTPAAWLAATASLATSVHRGVPDATLIGNGLGDGARYFDHTAPSAQILAGLDGGIAETWLRTSGQPVDRYPSVQRWKKDVDLLQATDKSVFVETKLWTRSTAQEQAAWHVFALASFLLGTGGNAYFAFSGARKDSGVTPDELAAHLRIGSPVAPYGQLDGVYRRTFSNGTVVVDPSSEPSTIDLGADYRDVAGNVVRSVTLAPHSAMILTRV